jgi:hypothetical protein
VVNYYNGTVVEVAKIPGNLEYLELMARLAKSKPLLQSTRNLIHELPSCLVEYLFPSVSSPWRDWWRWLNMKLGRPIKADGVEIISDLLRELKIATEKAISQPLDRVAVTEWIIFSRMIKTKAYFGIVSVHNSRSFLGSSNILSRISC